MQATKKDRGDCLNNVKIGNLVIPMKCNAATDAYYEKIFGVSSIILQSGTDLPSGEMVDLFYKMGFVMAMQAQHGPFSMNKLTRKNYYRWLNGFERSDYIDAIWKIRLIYEGWSDSSIDEYEKMNGG